jgi:hypothetical protein
MPAKKHIPTAEKVGKTFLLATMVKGDYGYFTDTLLPGLYKLVAVNDVESIVIIKCVAGPFKELRGPNYNFELSKKLFKKNFELVNI